MVGAVPDKEASELWAFSAAILPWISLCDADVGATLLANADISSATAPMSDGYVAVKTQLESVYECMGITCEQVGGLVDDSGAYLTGFEPCVDGGSTATTGGVFADIAGYSPGLLCYHVVEWFRAYVSVSLVL